LRSLADALELSEEERTALADAIPRRSTDAPLPAVEAAATYPPALPASLTPLLGREPEVKEIVGLLGQAADAHGPRGYRQDRLAIEVARKAEGHYFPDGVAFVALAPLGDAALVMPTVSQVLGLREAAGVRSLEVLRQHLPPRLLPEPLRAGDHPRALEGQG
jgi:hypothetical protein